MTIDELIVEYEHQAEVLDAKIDSLRPLLRVYRGEDLFRLRKKIKIYYDMACECRRSIALMRGHYIDEDEK